MDAVPTVIRVLLVSGNDLFFPFTGGRLAPSLAVCRAGRDMMSRSSILLRFHRPTMGSLFNIGRNRAEETGSLFPYWLVFWSEVFSSGGITITFSLTSMSFSACSYKSIAAPAFLLEVSFGLRG